jgi:ABC-type dipeptide/oligopeptide/nickel transport system permease component
MYVVRRILWSIVVLFVISLTTFVLIHLIVWIPPCFCGDRACAPETIKACLHKYGLDKPPLEQYIDWLIGLIRGNLGVSFNDPRSVNQIIGDEFPVSASFGLTALLVGIASGLPFGVLSALRRNSRLDRIGTMLIAMIVSVPTLVVGIVLVVVFAVDLRLVSIRFERNAWQSWLLPLFLLSLRIFALMARLSRTATLDILGEDYIRTAHMKGLPNSLVVRRHIFRNALVPIVTLLGPLAADVMTGSFIVESLFSIPGLGRDFVTSITGRDYPLLMGVTMFYAILLIIFNLLVDLTYPIIDPRIAQT